MCSHFLFATTFLVLSTFSSTPLTYTDVLLTVYAGVLLQTEVREGVAVREAVTPPSPTSSSSRFHTTFCNKTRKVRKLNNFV